MQHPPSLGQVPVGELNREVGAFVHMVNVVNAHMRHEGASQCEKLAHDIVVLIPLAGMAFTLCVRVCIIILCECSVTEAHTS